MKKYLPHIDLITLAVAAIGILLRMWHLGSGVDEQGLYPANHMAWTLLLRPDEWREKHDGSN